MSSSFIPPLLEIRDVVRHFPAGHGRVVHAVDGVSLSLQAGETLALVGESGCGKSTLGRLIVHLERPDSGAILLDGQDIARLTERQIRALRIKMQMIFQDPSTSLDPRWTVDAIIREPLNNYRLGTPAERTEAINVLLAKVGLQQEHARRFPHELSGGQKQRVGIARALALSPKIIVADEPVSALDVSVRAQVINLLSDLKDAYGLSLVLISHDIGIVAHISARIAVMYLGRIVEIGQTADVLGDPKHPYTRALLEAVPVSNPAHRRHRAPLDGDPPSPTDLPKGCSFQSRCPHVKPKCGIAPPPLQTFGTSRAVACVRVTDGEL